ncbi:hypothetical protein [Neptunicella sp. SCSIO 80796]|uniref:hypothetical protein n=1 Tax=Neptunicella plasticusilytica TaxID=3117012 RepID=UPI003A4E1DEA
MKPWHVAIVIISILAGYLMLRPNLNVRNNNPLNIRFNAANNWDGQVGENAGFAVFANPVYGFRAAYKLVKKYIGDYGLGSISEIITRWAPVEDDNHTEAYIDYIAEKLNKFTWTPVSESEIPSLLYWMAEYEGANGAFSFDQVNNGIALA